MTTKYRASTIPDGEWSFERDKRLVRHKSGLSVQAQKTALTGLPALNIDGLILLQGTPWAARANVLVEQGIFLLKTA